MRHDQVEYSLLGLVDVGRLSIGELKSENAKAPDVDLAVVLVLAPNQLGRHPADSTHLAHAFHSLLGELGCVTEVSQLQVTLLVDEDVVRLDVSVDDVPLVEVVQSFQCLVEDVGTHVLGDVAFPLFYDRREAASVHKLKEDPKSLLVFKGLVAPNDTFIVLAHLHDSQLVLDNVPFLGVFRLYELQGIHFISFFLLN